MSPFVGLALYGEGTTDHRFLEAIARRTVAEAFNSRSIVAEIPEVQRLSIDEGVTGRRERIRNGAMNEQGAFHVLFIHADGNGDADRAWTERVDPGRTAVQEELGTDGRAVVGIVPVRMTEAWALADGDALRRVLSTARTNDHLGLPGSGQLEGLADPKAVLNTVVANAHTRSRRRRAESGASYLDRIGEEIPLDALRALASYRQLQTDVDTALRHLGHIQ